MSRKGVRREVQEITGFSYLYSSVVLVNFFISDSRGEIEGLLDL